MPRSGALDALKVLLALLVVWFHAGAFREASPALGLLVDHGFGRIAVPTFLLINGYFFQPVLAHREQRRWMGGLLVMYAACTLFYMPFWLFSLPPGPEAALVVALRVLLGFNHLWYLAALLLAASLLLALRRWPPARLVALSAVLFMLGLALQLVGLLDLVGQPPWLARTLHSVHLSRNGLFVSFPFFCAGYLMRTFDWPARLPSGWIVAMVLLGVLGSLAEAQAYMPHLRPGKVVNLLACNALLTPGLFMGALRLQLRLPAWPLSKLATGIYLLHPLALVMLWQWHGIAAWQSAVGAALISGVASLGALTLMRRWRQRAYLSDSIRSM